MYDGLIVQSYMLVTIFRNTAVTYRALHNMLRDYENLL